MSTAAVPRIALTPDEAAEAVGIGKVTIQRAIRSGALRAKRTGANGGGKYLVKVIDLEQWFDGLGDA